MYFTDHNATNHSLVLYLIIRLLKERKEEMKTKIKKRVTRFQPSITKRKAEVYFEGRSLDLNDARIKVLTPVPDIR
jgi:hypothetical protein